MTKKELENEVADLKSQVKDLQKTLFQIGRISINTEDNMEIMKKFVGNTNARLGIIEKILLPLWEQKHKEKSFDPMHNNQ